MEFFAWRRGDDLHAGFEDVLLLGEHQIRAATAEQIREHLLEIGAHLVECFGEHLTRLLVNAGDHLFQLGLGVHQIFVLRVEEIEALFDLLIFVDCHQVHWPHAVDLVLHLLDFRPDDFPVGGGVGLGVGFIGRDGLGGGLTVSSNVNGR